MSNFSRLRTRVRGELTPPEVRRGLLADDRLVAWATTPDGAFVVASRTGLRLPDGRLLGWDHIDKAVWQALSLALTEAVEVAPGIAEDLPPVTLTLADPRDLPAAVRERVTHSVAFTAHNRLPGGSGVRVVGRRVAGQDGLAWSVRYDDPGQRLDAGSQAAAEQMLAAARASMTLAE